MGRKVIPWLLLCLFTISAALAMDAKNNAGQIRVTDRKIEQLLAAPQFRAAEQCTVRHAGDAWWLINHWITGVELYKTFQHPAMTCTAPYPFEVDEVHIILYFAMPCTLYTSVDVETANMTDPSCPVPGDLLSISSEYMFRIPDAGLWHIAVPLDSVATVNEPYFAGFYISNEINDTLGVAMVTDTVPELCYDYNMWDEEIGYIDLSDNEYYNFPGKILLFSSGTTGGTGGYDPMPELTYLSPGADEPINGPLECWVVESSGSEIVDSVHYEYRTDGISWQRISSHDFSNHALRNGVNPSGSGPGFFTELDYSGFNEAIYRIRATAFDTLMRTKAITQDILIDPTPPNINIVNPEYMDTICVPATLQAETADDDIISLRYYKKMSNANYTVPIIALDQSQYGDTDENPDDGNPVSEGEYGDYYCGPVAGAIAVKYWTDMGYTELMEEGAIDLTVDDVVEKVAEYMQTRDRDGTYDDFFVYGMELYSADHGGGINAQAYHNPDYMTLRVAMEERGELPVLGLSGTPGIYLTVAGLYGYKDVSDQYQIAVSDPISGTIYNTYMIDVGTNWQVLYDGKWLNLDIIITTVGSSHSAARDLVGTGQLSGGYWAYDWVSTTKMTDDSLYYITVITVDGDTRIDTTSTMVRYHCNINRVKGDYDGDGNPDAEDVLYLINFIYKGGEAPVGGQHRADTNCDHAVDLSDIIYLIKYIYSGGDEPCY